MNDRDEQRQAEAPAGLCGSCRHARVITTDRGSRFIMCELSKTNPRFPRYPPLPVRVCSGYEPDVAGPPRR